MRRAYFTLLGVVPISLCLSDAEGVQHRLPSEWSIDSDMDIRPIVIERTLSAVAFTGLAGGAVYSGTHSIGWAIVVGIIFFAVMGGISAALWMSIRDDPSVLGPPKDSRYWITAVVLRYLALGAVFVPLAPGSRAPIVLLLLVTSIGIDHVGARAARRSASKPNAG